MYSKAWGTNSWCLSFHTESIGWTWDSIIQIRILDIFHGWLMIVHSRSKTNQVLSIFQTHSQVETVVVLVLDWNGTWQASCFSHAGASPGSDLWTTWLLDPTQLFQCFQTSVFVRWNCFYFESLPIKYTTLNCDVTALRQTCAYFYFLKPVHALLLTEHTTHTVTHPLISWLSCITCCSLSVEADMDSCHSSHLTGWLTVCVYVCVCVCLCVPGALPSLASFSVWCSWWALWRPCAYACACAWRMGEGHVLACLAPPTSTLWPRAIQVGLQKCGARKVKITWKQNQKCQSWRLVQENNNERKETNRIRGNKNACFRHQRNDHLEVILYVLHYQNLLVPSVTTLSFQVHC